jgi:6-phosphofructokinase
MLQPCLPLLLYRYGFRGFYDKGYKPITLKKSTVDGIHLQGGTILGTSRGGADIKWVLRQDADARPLASANCCLPVCSSAANNV